MHNNNVGPPEIGSFVWQDGLHEIKAASLIEKRSGFEREARAWARCQGKIHAWPGEGVSSPSL
jgi:hypothetical protein